MDITGFYFYGFSAFYFLRILLDFIINSFPLKVKINPEKSKQIQETIQIQEHLKGPGIVFIFKIKFQ